MNEVCPETGHTVAFCYGNKGLLNTADKIVFREAGGYGLQQVSKTRPIIFNTANKNVIRETGRESF